MTGGPGEIHAAQPLKQNLEVPFGWFPQPVYFATIMRRHMHEFGTTEEQFGAIAVACRRHANHNPAAVMHEKTMTLDDYLASPLLAEPLRMLDSLPDLRRRRRLRHDDARARTRPAATSGGRRRGRRGPTPSRAGTGASSATSPHAAGVLPRRPRSRWPGSTPGDVDVLTVYDPFTVVSLMQIEDMGFCEKGDAGAFVEGDALHVRRRQAAVQHPRRAAVATPTSSASPTSSRS